MNWLLIVIVVGCGQQQCPRIAIPYDTQEHCEHAAASYDSSHALVYCIPDREAK